MGTLRKKNIGSPYFNVELIHLPWQEWLDLIVVVIRLVRKRLRNV